MSAEQTGQLTPVIEKLYDKSGIATRYMSVPDFLCDDPSEFTFFGPSWSLEPRRDLAQVMEVFERVSLDISEKAAREALAQAGIEPEQVTHLVISTCTGFFAPGPDVLLSMRLGLRPTVRRTIIGFMGCYAGFNGMRTADQIVRAEPDAVVLQICVELCGIHWQVAGDLNSLIGNCLFADGCSAAVYAATDGDNGVAELVTTHSAVADDSLDDMQWRLGPIGFRFHLSAEVPNVIRQDVEQFVDGLLDLAPGMTIEDIREWAVHPGGRRIVESVKDALALPDENVTHSFGVLRDFGNMSSATIFFVLQRHLEAGLKGPAVALGFGPGLTMEGAVLTPA